MEVEGEDGNIQFVNRFVPCGYNAGLYRQEDLYGTMFQFELKGKYPFWIKNFNIDNISALDKF